MKLIIAGDFAQRYRIDRLIKENNTSSMLKAIKPILEDTDMAIVNFEFPVVTENGTSKPIKKAGPNLIGTIGSIDVLKDAGFNCCTLANNHILDQGESCGIDTKVLLEKKGINTVGFGRNLTEASTILYKSFNGKTISIINCCEHEFSIATNSKVGANPLNPISQYHQIQEAKAASDFVIVIVHGGHEHFSLPSMRMKELYRFFIDVGADIVVNHHQHCYSGYETYKGKNIFYGLGNLCFDNPYYNHSFWNFGFLLKLNLGDGIEFELIPYKQCNEDPKIELLDDNEKNTFFSKIAKYNEIISNDILLMEEIEKYYNRCVNNEISILEPYKGKVLNKLMNLGVLPRFIKGNKIPIILNHIECESHRDKLVYALKQIKSHGI